ncbi:predicted protein [Naegleria gruberi]|uniref:Predicted protein n=1 Tax=Naegleria gruberi TaxID=5762 RepID=D2W1E3_NAEGR|nr:uncharacterized protein NAEGRDRAFT_75186 [Naegleria gruberi]EFC37033.1 predicted protein [Naegleria gruberi]|eukprot:XP_002669777.1 predicted protein [Naegleria gruberi strain NEG-M]
MDSHTLYVGGGTSQVPFKLYEEGYKRVTTIDYSEGAMESMRRKNTNPDLEFLTMDAKHTNFPSWYFDYIVDKACFESEFCADWTHGAKTYLDEINRILKPGGMYMMISHFSPDKRLPLLEVDYLQWTVLVERQNKPNFSTIPNDENDSFYYLYVCKKADVNKR